jgi:hypothetical protein
MREVCPPQSWLVGSQMLNKIAEVALTTLVCIGGRAGLKTLCARLGMQPLSIKASYA